MVSYEGTYMIQGEILRGGGKGESTKVGFEINPTTIDGITYYSVEVRLYAYPDFLIPFHQTLREIQRNNPDRDIYGEMAWDVNPRYRDLGPVELPIPIAWNQGTQKRIDGSDEPDQFVVLPFYRWEAYFYDNKYNRLLIGSDYFNEQNPYDTNLGREYLSPNGEFSGDPINQNELAELSLKATLSYNQSIDNFYIINWIKISNKFNRWIKES